MFFVQLTPALIIAIEESMERSWALMMGNGLSRNKFYKIPVARPCTGPLGLFVSSIFGLEHAPVALKTAFSAATSRIRSKTVRVEKGLFRVRNQRNSRDCDLLYGLDTRDQVLGNEAAS